MTLAKKSPLINLTTWLESLACTHREWWSSGCNDIPIPPHWLPAVITFKRPSGVKTVDQRFSNHANPAVIIHHIPNKDSDQRDFQQLSPLLGPFLLETEQFSRLQRTSKRWGSSYSSLVFNSKLLSHEEKKNSWGWTLQKLSIFFLMVFLKLALKGDRYFLPHCDIHLIVTEC